MAFWNSAYNLLLEIYKPGVPAASDNTFAYISTNEFTFISGNTMEFI